MRKFAFILLIFNAISAFCQNPNDTTANVVNPLKIKWVQEMPGNFRFRHKWSYPEKEIYWSGKMYKEILKLGVNDGRR